MLFVFGGAYQGKLEYVQKNYEVETVWECEENPDPECYVDFSSDVIHGVEKFVKYCVENDMDPIEYFDENHGLWAESIIIMDDISQGLVPEDEAMRKYREVNGKLMTYFAKEAKKVVRVFCGIGKQLK